MVCFADLQKPVHGFLGRPAIFRLHRFWSLGSLGAVGDSAHNELVDTLVVAVRLARRRLHHFRGGVFQQKAFSDHDML